MMDNLCEGCRRVQATEFYGGEYLCELCAREYYMSDLEEVDFLSGDGED